MTRGNDTTSPAAGGGSKPAGGCVAPCPLATPEPWLRDALAIMCPKDKAFLDGLRTRGVTITAFDRIYYEDPYYDGTKWTTKHFEGGGSTSGTHISLLSKNLDDKGNLQDADPSATAQTIFHEGTHTGQPASMPWSEKEYDAYTKSEQWAIDHGLKETFPGFRGKDKSGDPIPDTAAIRKFVDKEYPIAVDKPSTPGGAQYKVVGKTAGGETELRNVNAPFDTKTRPPKAGDTFPGPQIEVPPGGRTVPSDQLKCP